MVRRYKRDGRGRFAGSFSGSARRGRKIKRLQAKNNRVVKQYAKDKSLHGTPFGNSIERAVIGRAVKISKLQAKQNRRR